MIATVALFLIAGLVGGIVNSAAGGAKLFVFPLLLATGLPPIAANVTQGVALWPSQWPAIWVYRHELLRDLSGLLRQMAPALVGALVGSLVMVSSSDDVFKNVVPILLVVAVLAIVLGPRTADFMRWIFPGERLKAATAVLLALFGFYGGFFGAGLGFMLLAVLSASSGSGIGSVNGAKNLIAAGIQTVAVVPMMMSGLVDWLAATCVLIGGLIGGYAGAKITRKLPEKYLRVGVAALGLALTLSFLLK